MGKRCILPACPQTCALLSVALAARKDQIAIDLNPGVSGTSVFQQPARRVSAKSLVANSRWPDAALVLLWSPSGCGTRVVATPWRRQIMFTDPVPFAVRQQLLRRCTENDGFPNGAAETGLSLGRYEASAKRPQNPICSEDPSKVECGGCAKKKCKMPQLGAVLLVMRILSVARRVEQLEGGG